jgi:aldehyde:ferredoxin oxidoreductase
MTISGGFADKILRVDLSKGSISCEPLPSEEVLRKYLGGTGLGLYYLLKETPAGVKATDPEALFMLMTGPLAGTPAPSSSNWVTVCLHGEIPYAAGVGHGHGWWAAYLKHAGYEGVIISGKAKKPVYLWIDGEQVELRDATHLWGQGTRETERRIKIELEDEENISVACIGPAGESLLPGASVKADRNHGAGKGSPGMVMGSKLLKAVAVRGKRPVPLAQPEAMLEAAMQWDSNITHWDPAYNPDHPAPATGLKDGGITRNYYTRLGKYYRVASKNLTDPQWGVEYAKKYVDLCSRWKVTPVGSYNCNIQCSYNVEITDGPFTGLTLSFCGGGENTEGPAAMIGVDGDAAFVMTDFYDDIGVESGTLGSLMGMVYEAYNAGLLTKEDTGGLELTWGNWEASMELINQMIRHQGFGAKLLLGLKEAPRVIGEEQGAVEEFLARTLHLKGAGINMHDWRHFWSVMFGQLVAGSGPSHQGTGADYQPQAELGFSKLMPGFVETPEEALMKVESVRKSQFAKLFWDSLGVCWFAAWGVTDAVRLSSQTLAYAVGWDDFTANEALQCGERITNLMRLVYQQRGFKKSDELDASPRWLEPAVAGPAKGLTIAPYLPAMVDEYYEQMGWNVETGLPLPETLERLGMDEFVQRTG